MAVANLDDSEEKRIENSRAPSIDWDSQAAAVMASSSAACMDFER